MISPEFDSAGIFVCSVLKRQLIKFIPFNIVWRAFAVKKDLLELKKEYLSNNK